MTHQWGVKNQFKATWSKGLILSPRARVYDASQTGKSGMQKKHAFETEKDGGSWNAICGVWQKCRGS